MKKYLLAATGALALSFSANANAALVVTLTGPTSGTFASSPVPCASTALPCTFNDVANFITPAGMQLVSATISSTRTSQATDINFSSVTLNGINFLVGSTGVTEFRFLNNLGIAPGGNNVLAVSGQSWGEGGYSGVLSFAAVPEPSTWLMMILGVGIAGAALRRRRQTVKVSYA